MELWWFCANERFDSRACFLSQMHSSAVCLQLPPSLCVSLYLGDASVPIFLLLNSRVNILKVIHWFPPFYELVYSSKAAHFVINLIISSNQVVHPKRTWLSNPSYPLMCFLRPLHSLQKSILVCILNSFCFLIQSDVRDALTPTLSLTHTYTHPPDSWVGDDSWDQQQQKKRQSPLPRCHKPTETFTLRLPLPASRCGCLGWVSVFLFTVTPPQFLRPLSHNKNWFWFTWEHMNGVSTTCTREIPEKPPLFGSSNSGGETV